MEKGDHYIFFWCIWRVSERTSYQRNRDVIRNRAKYFYKHDEERLRDNARDKYRNLSKEEKK